MKEGRTIAEALVLDVSGSGWYLAHVKRGSQGGRYFQTTHEVITKIKEVQSNESKTLPK